MISNENKNAERIKHEEKSGLIAGIVILILLCIGAGVLYQNMKPAASEGENILR